MRRLTKQISFKIFCKISFILLSSLLISQNIFSQKQWNRDFTMVTYSPSKNSITFCFIVLDNYYGPSLKSGYLKLCDFYFTIDGKNYNHLMRAETTEQKIDSITKFMLKYRHHDANIQFLGCTMPKDGSWWPNVDRDQTVHVKNKFGGSITINKNNKKIKVDKFIALFTIRWFLRNKYDNVKRIKLDGVWQLTGDSTDNFKDVYYDIPSSSLFQSKENELETNQVKVTANADDIVVTGCKRGEKIKVHTITGLEVRKSEITGEVVTIKLPKNHIYTVSVGESHYKLAL